MREVFRRHRSEVDYRTPLDLYMNLDEEFGPFDLDAAASFENALCEKFFTVEENGLAQSWEGRIWVNPPYDDIMPWVAKARKEIELRAEVVVMLLPARATCTQWFRFAWEKCTEIRFIHGRLNFTGPFVDESASGASFPSMIVVFSSMQTLTPVVQLCDRQGHILTGFQSTLGDF